MARNIGSIGRELDLLLRQGATFEFGATLNIGGVPVDLTGCNVMAHVRRTALAGDPPALVFDVTMTEPAAGKFRLSATAAATAALGAGEQLASAESGYVWDCELHDTLGRITPLMFGRVQVFREVTRA